MQHKSINGLNYKKVLPALLFINPYQQMLIINLDFVVSQDTNKLIILGFLAHFLSH